MSNVEARPKDDKYSKKLLESILKQLVNSLRKPGAKFWMSSRQERNLN